MSQTQLASMFIGNIKTVDYDIESQMMFDLVPTDEGFKPYIIPQHWSVANNDWVKTGYDEGTEPMPVLMLRTEEYKRHLNDMDYAKSQSLDYLTQAINTMQYLISKSS